MTKGCSSTDAASSNDNRPSLIMKLKVAVPRRSERLRGKTLPDLRERTVTPSTASSEDSEDTEATEASEAETEDSLFQDAASDGGLWMPPDVGGPLSSDDERVSGGGERCDSSSLEFEEEEPAPKRQRIEHFPGPKALGARVADTSAAVTLGTPESGGDGKERCQVKASSETGNPQAQAVTTPAAKAQARHVVLTVPTSPTSNMEYVVSEEVLARIPFYATKLDEAKSQTPPGQRIGIRDEEQRDREAMLDLIDYVTYGALEDLPEGGWVPKPNDAYFGLGTTIRYARAFGLRDLAKKLQVQMVVFERTHLSALAGLLLELARDVEPPHGFWGWCERLVKGNLRALAEKGELKRFMSEGGRLGEIVQDALIGGSSRVRHARDAVRARWKTGTWAC